MAILRCPTDSNHKQFVVEVVIPTRWIIKPDGEFVSEAVARNETRYVSIEWRNVGEYVCFICGSQAVVDLPEGGVAWPG